MNYQYLNSSIEKDNIILPNSDKINPFLLKNNYAEIIKGVDFIASEEKPYSCCQPAPNTV